MTYTFKDIDPSDMKFVSGTYQAWKATGFGTLGSGVENELARKLGCSAGALEKYTIKALTEIGVHEAFNEKWGVGTQAERSFARTLLNAWFDDGWPWRKPGEEMKTALERQK